ncbi:hypothetical protein WOLCODRAFT_148016 [Wolfiporia cocos MD-104 SS10]|uniref:Uncharacterized protein n=1 Tax=Wolfiporia cocos (strain MD-104) TaxID=742152 RepID=A0A2H3IW37_WOLCO|nr:hypothetical protein WOLCODRAFT_148016 [Wolfiporia cocos MD-104 SS10]
MAGLELPFGCNESSALDKCVENHRSHHIKEIIDPHICKHKCPFALHSAIDMAIKMVSCFDAVSLRRHLLATLSIVLDGIVLAVLFSMYRYEFLLPTPKDELFQKSLPTIGAVIGALVVAVNAMAITELVTAYARSMIVREGLTFAMMDHLHSLANVGIPFALTSLFLLGGLIVLAQGLLPSDHFGDLYNSALASLRDDFPVNSSRNGVTYPSSLMGISGAISSLTQDYVGKITDDPSRAIIASDTFDACVPRMVIDVTCNTSLKEGQWFNMSYYTVRGPAPQGIVGVSLCNGTVCGGARYAPHFAGGVTIVFWDMDETTGNTTVSIYNFGTYVNDWGAQNISCVVGAHEEMVPIRITGGTAVTQLPEMTCPQRSQPSSHFLLNVTRQADMTVIKMQGPDGDLEPMSMVPDGQNRLQAFELALERLVATGATEMYATMYANSSVASQWTGSVPFTYTTMRTRLGLRSRSSLFFAVSPIILVCVLIAGWILVTYRKNPAVVFDPLHPSCAMAAGLNREKLPPELAARANIDRSELDKLPLLLHFGQVADARMGITATTIVNVPHSGLYSLRSRSHPEGAKYASVRNLDASEEGWNAEEYGSLNYRT